MYVGAEVEPVTVLQSVVVYTYMYHISVVVLACLLRAFPSRVSLAMWDSFDRMRGTTSPTHNTLVSHLSSQVLTLYGFSGAVCTNDVMGNISALIEVNLSLPDFLIVFRVTQTCRRTHTHLQAHHN